jgi:hypothetical protein
VAWQSGSFAARGVPNQEVGNQKNPKALWSFPPFLQRGQGGFV